jgi:hypothetical protein
MPKVNSEEQYSFIDPDGQLDGYILTPQQRVELEETFPTIDQKKRAYELMRSGEAKNPQEAKNIMNKEDLEHHTNDQYERKKR